MVKRCVLTAVGTDRPGIVERVSKFVFARHASIEDSRMINLHGQFAMAALISGSEDAIASVNASLDNLRSTIGGHAELTPVDEHAGRTRAALYRLTGRALDQAGLVHEIAGVLRTRDVNIESMNTGIEPAPVTGTPIFSMDLLISVPKDVSLEVLRADLGDACAALNIDWSITQIPRQRAQSPLLERS